MRYRLALMVALSFVLAVFLYAQGQAGPDPQPTAALSVRYPMDGIDDMTWSELLAMLGVLSVVGGLIQWVIVKIIVQPQIEKSIKAATKEIMTACLEQFTSKYAFGLHEEKNTGNHQAVLHSIQELVESRDEENERVTDVRERVRVLEARTARR